MFGLRMKVHIIASDDSESKSSDTVTLLSNSGGSDKVVKLVCWNCGASLAEQPTPIRRHDQCPCCFEVLHCCRMCRYYAPGKTIDCEEERADPPMEKASANFCDFFRPMNRFDSACLGRTDRARHQLDSLFGASEADGAGEMAGNDGSNDAALRKLDDLFDD
ncbi:MAG: hypothetical protein CMP98_12495 [Gammaproteobacteria bacterium]|nr:hypothetical protein [Gammaproteobacteria bacterium]OUU07499.1 MAG: hypothetical protein CBB94_13120 [Gammaproteobacteria bacterium TMED34]